MDWRKSCDIGGCDVSRDVLYEPGGKVDLIRAVFSRYLSCMPRAIKIVLSALNVKSFGITSLRSLIEAAPSLVFVVKFPPRFLH